MKFTSPILAQASGSVGGAVYSHNRGGQYIRNRVTPVNPATAAQVAVRNTFGNLSTAWSSLSVTERQAWETYAINVPLTDVFGRELVLTGQQMFVRNNSARVAVGLAALVAAPTTFNQAALGPVSASISAATQKVSVTFTESDAWVSEDGAALGVYNSRDMGLAINFFKGPYRFAGKIDGDSVAPPTSPDATIDAAFIHAQGSVDFFRFVAFHADGRISPVARSGPQVVLA